MMQTYRVFSRRPWRKTRRGGFESAPSPPGRSLATGLSLAEAREFCKQGPANIARDEGREYRHLPFFEFTAE